jgi:uncharacterized protein
MISNDTRLTDCQTSSGLVNDINSNPSDIRGNHSCNHKQEAFDSIRTAIEHAAHLLPSQGPISVFVHHNTLHAFEDLPFDDAVLSGLDTFGGQPYLSEDRFRAEFATGRIRPSDIAAALLDDLGDAGDELLGFFGTRFHLRMAMLEHPMYLGTDAELEWFIAETQSLYRFRLESDPAMRGRMIESTKQLADHLGNPDSCSLIPERLSNAFQEIANKHHRGNWAVWNASTWEAVTLHLLWSIIDQGLKDFVSNKQLTSMPSKSLRHRDAILGATGQDIDLLVNPLLISFTGAFLDQGFATWSLPNRSKGYFRSFIELFRDMNVPTEHWRRSLPTIAREIADAKMTPLESIADSLKALGVADDEQEAFISQTFNPLRGWAGMIWQLETSAEWTVRPAPAATLIEFMAVRLILERIALRSVIDDHLLDRVAGRELRLDQIRSALRHYVEGKPRVSLRQSVFLVFQLAQVRGWLPTTLVNMKESDWSTLITELECFSTIARRRIYHLAYERRYRNQALDAISIHSKERATDKDLGSASKANASFQVVCCIDDREESFRRHLEEVAPECETFGIAGFFAIAMYYRGVADAYFRPLCPAVIKPQHYVIEEVSYSFESSDRTRARNRQRLGTASHRLHLGTRSIFAGVATSLIGSFAAVPMVGRILFPRLTAQIKRLATSFTQPPASTKLILERVESQPSAEVGHVGFTVSEMVTIVKRILEDMGAVGRLSRLVIFVGHGSSSLNNPHESAYNCGACSGAQGGPNARSFARMANDPRVRQELSSQGINIPQGTVFVGAIHNTCDDDVAYFDLDDLPVSHRVDFEKARSAIDEARGRNALERCRRFESAVQVRSTDEALRHVETRSEDLSQARPEYNHATNAMIFVGRRSLTRGLYLDRRAFLISYDPTTDDATHSILARILAAAIPVCSGISLEYYFSCVDPIYYGCGSKLPHNIASLLGVMEGAASDLRTGLSAQMVEIHEPMRILAVIEATVETMEAIMKENATINRLVSNRWIQLALLDPESKEISLFRNQRFEGYSPESTALSECASSYDWYRQKSEHLPFASVRPLPVDSPVTWGPSKC